MKNPICEICGKNAEVEPLGCAHYQNEPYLMRRVQLLLDSIPPEEVSAPVRLFRELELHAIAMTNELQALKQAHQQAEEAWARYGASRRKKD